MKRIIVILLSLSLLLGAFLPLIATVTAHAMQDISDEVLSEAVDEIEYEQAAPDEENNTDSVIDEEQTETEEPDRSEEAEEIEETEEVEEAEEPEEVLEVDETEEVEEIDEAEEIEEIEEAEEEEEEEEEEEIKRAVEDILSVSNALEDFTIINMGTGFNTDFTQTIAQNPGNLVLVLHNNFTWGSALDIPAGRNIIITSAGTDLSDHTNSNASFIITRDGDHGRHFWINSGAELTISNIILDGAAATGSIQRGGVFVGPGGTLIMENGSIIRNCFAQNRGEMGTLIGTGNGSGGGVRVHGGTLIMEAGSLITQNRATLGSGVRADTGATVIINGGAIDNNVGPSGGHGGGIQAEGAGTTLTMNEGSISGNTAGARGGGVRFLASEFNMYGGTISNNQILMTDATATNRQSGGGVYVGSGTFNMHGGVIENNRAVFGGGVSVPWADGVFNMYGGIIRNNIRQAVNNEPITEGGGVWVAESAMNMYGGEIRNNRALRGGGVWAGNGGRFVMNRTATNPVGGIIAGNEAVGRGSQCGGGGVMIHSSGFEMIAGLIEGNNAVLRGGGVNFNNVQGRVSGGTIRNNRVTEGSGAGLHLTMGSNIVMSGGEVIGNTASESGGGLQVWNSDFTMRGGTISGNTATNGGGVNISGNSGQRVFTMSGGTIGGLRNQVDSAGNAINNANTANSGGGVRVSGANATFIMEEPSNGGPGGIIIGNDSVMTGNSDGGGVRVDSGARFEMRDGSIQNNTTARFGGGVDIHGSTVIMSGGAISENESGRGGGGVLARNSSTFTINDGKISRNRARTESGGGIALDNSTFTMIQGEISGNVAALVGGGINVWAASAARPFNIQGGTISGNVANNGGGINIPHNTLAHMTINSPTVFSDNVARHGLQIDTPLANNNHPRIGPGTVSVTGKSVIDRDPNNPDVFISTTINHAFTNFDINATGSVFWRVTYEVGEGAGEIKAVMGQGDSLIPSGSLVADGAVLTFAARPIDKFVDWEIWTNVSGTGTGGTKSTETNNPLGRTITTNTHVVGNFIPPPTTTTLSVSKIVTGDLGNKNFEFEFTVFFTDSNGGPLPYGMRFDYNGDIISGSGATAPSDGTLVLDSEGSAVFSLRHGQRITIDDVPLDGNVRVVETFDPNYTTTFTDSENADVIRRGNDTEMLPMAAERTLNFTNGRDMPPPTGLGLGNVGAAILLPLIVIMTALIAYLICRNRKRK